MLGLCVFARVCLCVRARVYVLCMCIFRVYGEVYFCLCVFV